jgi:hypothetical protein
MRKEAGSAYDKWNISVVIRHTDIHCNGTNNSTGSVPVRSVITTATYTKNKIFLFTAGLHNYVIRWDYCVVCPCIYKQREYVGVAYPPREISLMSSTIGVADMIMIYVGYTESLTRMEFALKYLVIITMQVRR